MMVKRTKGQKTHQFHNPPYRFLILGALVLLLLFVITRFSPNLISVRSLFTRPTPLPTVGLLFRINPPGDTFLPLSKYEEMAVNDLSAKIHIAPENITIQKSENHTWNDSSLGCPQKGYFYSQMISPGYIIELTAAGKTYQYHGGLNQIVSCQGN